MERNVRSLALVLAAEERSDLKSEDNPIEIDTFEINNERVDNATIDSTLASNVEEVKEDTDYDNVHYQVTEELPREVKKLVADNVGSDNGPTVRDGEEAEPTSSGRKRWKVKKFGF